MSATREHAAGSGERVLAFEVGGGLFALPIEDVLEVADLSERSFVPTLPSELVGVATHRGDALPVVDARAVLGLGPSPLPPPTQLLVLGRVADEPGRLGLPVERVLGLAAAPRGTRGAAGAVRARGTLDGRMLRVLDAGRLVATAEEAIARAVRGEVVP